MVVYVTDLVVGEGAGSGTGLLPVAQEGEPLLHGTVETYRLGCRCVECASGYQAWEEAGRAGTRPLDIDDAPHGTLAGARTWKCACPDCIDATDTEVAHGTREGSGVGCRCQACRRFRVERRREAGASTEGHGTLVRYALHGCRCPACRLARREASEADRDRWPHGSVERWAAGGRCEDCKAGAKRRRHLRWRVQQRHASALASAELPHGTRTGYRRWRCRCELCQEAKRRYDAQSARAGGRRWLAQAAAQAEAGASIPHGTLIAYKDYRCRCEECRAANRAYYQEWRRKAQGEGRVPHGTVTGYSNWGCRCEPCTAANSEYRKRRKERRQAEVASQRRAEG